MGQHFLHDEHVCRKIITALQENGFTRLLEVGPGGGALTKYLMTIPGIYFTAVELDQEKIDHLRQIYPGLAEKIIHADFLDLASTLR